MIYTHKFNSHLTCTVELLDRQIQPGESHVVKSIWSQKPKSKHIPEYVRWMHLVNDTYAKEHHLKLLHVYQLGPKYRDWQLWAYSPDKPPFRFMIPNLPGGPLDIDTLNKELAATRASFILSHQTNF